MLIQINKRLILMKARTPLWHNVVFNMCYIKVATLLSSYTGMRWVGMKASNSF